MILTGGDVIKDFARIAVAVPMCRPADCDNNADEIIKIMREADAKQVKVIAFPELCITGYTCGDMFMQDALIKAGEAALEKIMRETAGLNIFAAVGLPVRVDSTLFNCAVCICKGVILGIVPKTYLKNYGDSYEERWFAPSDVKTDIIFECENFNIGVEIGEDLQAVIPPSSYHALAGADIILNLSAQSELVYQDDSTRNLIAQQSAGTISVYAYANAGTGESTTDSVYAGYSLICENGEILVESEKLKRESQFIYCDCDIAKIRSERRRISTFSKFNKNNISEYQRVNFNIDNNIDKIERKINAHPFIPAEHERALKCENILNIQAAGLAKRLEHAGLKTAVINVSGGLDSTLALLATVRAFDYLNRDRKDIIGLVLRGFGTTERTYNNALELMRVLNISYREIPIIDACLLHFKDIGHDPEIHDITYENVQARERTRVLMNIANKEGGLAVGTGDLSEIALGWCTYNADHISMYNVNCGIAKTLVKVLIAHAADIMPEASAVLRDILDTPVSPELLPAGKDGEITQITEDFVGPYELHDFFLYYMIRFNFSPKKIFAYAEFAFDGKYNRDEIKKWLIFFYRRFFANQFKRSCMPDGPKVGSVGLSPRADLKMPSDMRADIWLKELDDI